MSYDSCVKQTKGSFAINKNITKLQREENFRTESMYWSFLIKSPVFDSGDQLYKMHNIPIMEDLNDNHVSHERQKIEECYSDSEFELNRHKYQLTDLKFCILNNNKFENITIFIDSDGYIDEVVTKSPNGYSNHELEEQTVGEGYNNYQH